MKKLDRLILQSFIGPFVATFFIALFVLVMQFLWKYIDDLVGKGLELSIIAELIFYASASLVPMALPIAVLLSSIMTFGNLGEHYELVALKSSGISLLRIMTSLIGVVILLAGVAFWFSNYVLPKANLKYGVLLYDITHKRPAFDVQEGAFYNGIDGYSLKVGKKSADGKTLHDVIIYDHTAGRGNSNVTLAEKAIMHVDPLEKYLTFQLFNGEQYEEQQAKPKPRKDDNFEHMRTRFKEYHKVFDMSGFEMKKTNEELFKKNYQMLNIRQLQYSVDSIEKEIDKRFNILHKNLKKFIALEKDTLNKDSLDMLTSDNRLKNKIPLKKNRHINYSAKDSFSKDSLLLARSSLQKMQNNGEDFNNKQPKLSKRSGVKKIDTINNNYSITKEQAMKTVDTLQENQIDSLRNYFFDPHPDSTVLAMIPLKYKNKVIKRALDNAKNSKGYVNVARRDVEIKQSKKNKYHMEWHRKFVLSVGCIMLFFIGAPLGAITRKGGLGLPMILAIVFFVLYHMLNTFGKKLSEEFVLSPFNGMWLSTIILTPLGIFLTYKALNDSNLINIDAYADWFRKRFQQLGLMKKESMV